MTAADRAGQAGRGRVRSLGRAIDILDLLSEDQPSLTLREIGAATGLPKTTVLRHVKSLEEGGLLWADGQGRYVLGPRLARLGSLAARTWAPSPVLRSVLAELAQRAHETAHLYVRRGVLRVCIARQEADRTLRHVVEIGQSWPLWGGAASKVLLIDTSDAVLRMVAAEAPPGGPTLAELRLRAAQARRAGWAASEAELEPGLSSVAVPLTALDGTVVAALSFGGPTARFGAADVTRMLEDLRWGAGQLPQSLLPGTSPGASYS
jgi:DNA-binding IclR family transcriptional regulator